MTMFRSPSPVHQNERGQADNGFRFASPPPLEGILRKPTAKCPEDPDPIREGVAPMKDAKKGKDIPPDARWTKIDRRLVNQEALENAKERFEERLDCVIVLRVLTHEDIQNLAHCTMEIRVSRAIAWELRGFMNPNSTDIRILPSQAIDPPPMQNYTRQEPRDVELHTARQLIRDVWPYTTHQVLNDSEVRELITNAMDIGHGAFGSVESLESIHVPGFRIVRKTLMILGAPRVAKTKREIAEKEARILGSLSHHHIVALIGSYEMGKRYSLLMHPVGDQDLGVFLDLVGESAQTSEYHQWIRTWFTCLTSALAHIHERCLRHEDIKPQNIIRRGRDIFFTDFNTSTAFDPGDTTSTETQACGTAFYQAPESRRGAEEGVGHSRRSDVFSLGCVFAEMLTVLSKRSTKDLHDNVKRSIKANGLANYVPGYCLALHELDEWFERASLDLSTIHQVILRPMLNPRRQSRPYATTVLTTIRKLQGLINLPCLCTACNSVPLTSDLSIAVTYTNGLPSRGPPLLRAPPAYFAAKAIDDQVSQADSSPTSEASIDLAQQVSPSQDRWAQIRKNAAERAARARSDDGNAGSDSGGEETIESRVARIKARVAELTGNMDSSSNVVTGAHC